MCNLRGKIKDVLVVIMVMVLLCSFLLPGSPIVFAHEEPESTTEYVSGRVYQFGGKGSYDFSSADKVFSTDSGAESGGKFSVTGSISSVKEKEGIPVFVVSGGTLKFSYEYDNSLLKASEDEDHLVNDNGKKVNGITLASEIKKGALIVQTSKDGEIWFNVPGGAYFNIFKEKPDGFKEFYTTTDVQMVNGCYYRVLVAYKTGVRTQKAQKFSPKLEKYKYKKYVEAYRFYAYDETAIDITVPEEKNRKNLGSKARTKGEGYAGSVSMDNDDPHFGWDIGQFFVGGYTDYYDDADGNPIFLKNNGDRLSLWFELQQDIDKCYNNSAIKVVADKEGSDAFFEVPGGVNETTDFARGALIVRKTNPDGTKEDPQVYTNYLEASASVDAETKVDLFEEGDYEVALDYAVKFDKTKILGKSILPETAKYRISFKFSVRNGNSLIFLFDRESGNELSSGSITENGFRIDFAGSKYLRVKVKREILKDGFDGLTEDTRFNSVAADGDEFTDEGIYTLTVTNRDLENVDPTVKRVYVGKNNILKAYMVNSIPVSEIKELIAQGATIAEDGTIIEPESELVPETGIDEETEASVPGSETDDKPAEPQDVSGSGSGDEDRNLTRTGTEQVKSAQQEETKKETASPVIPISIVAVLVVVGAFFFKNRKKR